MLCPVCRHDNFEGEDVCANCGADLSAADLPQPALEFHDTVLGEHLDRARRRASRASWRPGSAGRRGDPADARCRDRLPARLRRRSPGGDLHGSRRRGEGRRQALGWTVVRDFMTPDPVVLRRTTRSRSPSTRWRSAGSATSRSSTRRGGPSRSCPRSTSSGTSPPRSGERRAHDRPRADRGRRRRPDLGDPAPGRRDPGGRGPRRHPVGERPAWRRSPRSPAASWT